MCFPEVLDMQSRPIISSWLVSPHSCPCYVLRINSFTFLLSYFFNRTIHFTFSWIHMISIRPCVHWIYDLVQSLHRSVTYILQAKKHYVTIICLVFRFSFTITAGRYNCYHYHDIYLWYYCDSEYTALVRSILFVHIILRASYIKYAP